MAVRNYQRVSIAKEKEMSDVLYGKKHKTTPSHTVTSAETANFNVGTLSQMDMKPQVHRVQAQVEVKKPIVNFGSSPIVVQPVVNLNAKDLVWNENGQLVMPEIKVELVVNIN